MNPISNTLAASLATATFEDLPAQTVTETRRAVLDWLGSVLGGSLEEPARITRQVVGHLGVSNEATVFAGGRSSALGAALANGVASHILELDDIHKTSTVHAAAPVISAALAVAEREHASGSAFLLSVALGYEAALRIGEAVNPSHYRFFHPTGTVATFGAGVAAASLMRLNTTEMLHTLGSAGTQAAGLWEFNADGAMSKHLHPGKAAMNGILAADLSRVGFTGARRILEGDRGFFNAMSATHDASRVVDGLGTQWKISENCYKVWACCGHTHSAIDVAVDMRNAQHWSGTEPITNIASLHIETYGPGYEIVSDMQPGTPFQAKFSIAYGVAAALLYGRVSLAEFTNDHFHNARVRDANIATLLDRTRVSVAPDLTAKYPGAWPTRVTVKLTNGDTLQGASDYPVGNPENPVTTLQLEEKFRNLVEPGWGKDTVQRALQTIHTLESIPDMALAFSQLGDRKTTPALAYAHHG